MPNFDPEKLAEWTGGSWVAGKPPRIAGFCFDARKIQAGECFVALSGGARDGHEFLEQAAQGGAVAALVEKARPIALPQLQVPDSLAALGTIAAARRTRFAHPVVAVTGSCGKTSTKEMLRCLLGEDTTHATAGNWNNRIGVPMTLFGLDAARQKFAVIEAGINQPGEMAQLGQMIHADLNVLTNIGYAHLELLGSLENIANEKSRLAACAKADSPIILPAEALQYAAYAALSERVIALHEEGRPLPGLPVRELLTYQIKSDEPEKNDSGPNHPEQRLILDSRTYRIASSSRGIAVNAALAIAAARQLGIAEADIKARIEAWRPSGQRGEIRRVGEQLFYVDCYNANPSSMADALGAFERITSQTVARYYILGAMNELGPHAEEQHTFIGQRLSLRPKDRVAFVGPEALIRDYAKGAQAAGAAPEQIQCTETAETLKSTVAQFKGAIFLKGSRSYQLEKLLTI
ncbi:MAG: UDP-N-acetylmuramoyl-tripeptide--D-alanyl-D-alanine ligase [Verrucomicrobia bacterium]|jgi:UDP-N-acetylmuramoyl-tripeptide--D-alanyl-D-alanine ligase|nr:UDP-N-acetylmuramoyl-tripeptide--D-alanyl-D-alanine ligase [Verrucomicrobiota bacterium]